MNVLKAVPLFLLIWIAYNLTVLFGNAPATLDSNIFSIGLVSGAEWTMSVRDVLIVAGILALYIEMFKSTRTGLASVIDHTLSTLVFVAFVIEFITVERAGNSTFFILGLMSLLDVIAGFTISIVAARRDFAIGESIR